MSLPFLAAMTPSTHGLLYLLSGMESTLAGWARILFSEAKAAALTWTIIILNEALLIREKRREPDKPG